MGGGGGLEDGGRGDVDGIRRGIEGKAVKLGWKWSLAKMRVGGERLEEKEGGDGSEDYEAKGRS